MKKLALYTAAYYIGYGAITLFGIFLFFLYQFYKTHWYIILIGAIVVLFGFYNLLKFHRYRQQSKISIRDPYIGAVIMLILIALLWILVHMIIALIFIPIAIVVFFKAYKKRKIVKKIKKTLPIMPPRILRPFPHHLIRKPRILKHKVVNPIKEQKEKRKKWREMLIGRFK